ncbi:hypothetical protein PISMIDRAFT_684065 [Pisolithus microcarpus 441]|uniref:Uncharacterized protein n=1 Tax=Pisolithus microcarpus 441 TaxID=765257 RepID=A0A0C9YXK3_9AGAM|nr:hypothetical protein BKA83DRAFT_684065 [Pisolithus microcarpus]KIK18614.1 hypothetical protein PISMIDRAFT_684065 [Pisolithus microcarpus 441]
MVCRSLYGTAALCQGTETLRLYAPVPLNVRLVSSAVMQFRWHASDTLSTLYDETEAVVWPGMNGGPPTYIPPNTLSVYATGHV